MPAAQTATRGTRGTEMETQKISPSEHGVCGVLALADEWLARCATENAAVHPGSGRPAGQPNTNAGHDRRSSAVEAVWEAQCAHGLRNSISVLSRPGVPPNLTPEPGSSKPPSVRKMQHATRRRQDAKRAASPFVGRNLPWSAKWLAPISDQLIITRRDYHSAIKFNHIR